MIERCEQTIITRISGLIKTPHTGCATTVYAAVNPELIGISRGYYKHSRAAPSWPSKAGRWDIILPVSRISKLQLHDIFEKKTNVSVRQCKIATQYFTGFFFWSLKKSNKSFISNDLFSLDKRFKNTYTFVYIYVHILYLIYLFNFFRDPEYQNFLWNCTRELLKKYIPSDIDKLLDVKVETNNKH